MPSQWQLSHGEDNQACYDEDTVEIIEYVMQVGVASDSNGASMRAVSVAQVEGALPDLRQQDQYELKWRVDACNKLRRVMGPLLDSQEDSAGLSEIMTRSWPALTLGQLFPGEHVDRWREFVGTRRKLWQMFAQHDQLRVRFGEVWDEYERQVRIAMRGAGAPPIERYTQGPKYDERGALHLSIPVPGAANDEHAMPAPCAAVRVAQRGTAAHNSVVRAAEAAPAAPGTPAGAASQSAADGDGKREGAPPELCLDAIVRPRYSQALGEMISAAHGMWPGVTRMPCATLRGLESGMYTRSVPLRVPLDRSDPMFGAASVLIVDGVRAQLRSAAAAQVAEEAEAAAGRLNLEEEADAAEEADACFAMEHADAFRAWAKLATNEPASGFAGVLCRRGGAPTRGRLRAIEAHMLYRAADDLPTPGDECYDDGADGGVEDPHMTVTIGHLVKQGAEPVGQVGGVAFDPIPNGALITDAEHCVSTVVYQGDEDGEECGFHMRVPYEGRQWTLRANPQDGHHLHVGWRFDEGDSEGEPGLQSNAYGRPSYAARRATYAPAAWSVEAITAAEEVAVAARAREPAVVPPPSFLSGRASLFDVDVLFALFSAPREEDGEGAPDPAEEARAGAPDPAAAAAAPPRRRKRAPNAEVPPEAAPLAHIVCNYLSMRRVDEMVKVSFDPIAGRPADTPLVWVCDVNTKLWQPRTEARQPSGKLRTTQAHGDAPTEMHGPVKCSLAHLRRLTRSKGFYDAMFAVVQLASYERKARLDGSRRKLAETVLKRVLASVRHEDLAAREPGEAPTPNRRGVFDEESGLMFGGGNTRDGHHSVSVTEWCDALRASAMRIIEDMECQVVAPKYVFRAFLKQTLASINEHADETMAQLCADSEALVFSPPGLFCTKDRHVYLWSHDRLVCEPLRSAHRIERTGVSPLSPDNDWVCDARNVSLVRTFLAADYLGCLDACAVGDDYTDAAPAADAHGRIARAYAEALATADALAATHTDEDRARRARRFYRSLIRLLGYRGGVQALLFELAVTVFGLRELCTAIIVTSHEDSHGGFIAGGGKTTLLRLCARLLYSHGVNQRFAFLEACDLNAEGGGVSPNPNLAAAIKAKALAIVVDEMNEDEQRQVNPTTANLLVPGNSDPTPSPWRALFEPASNELIRVASLWYMSNHKNTLARLLATPGQARRTRLLALECVFVGLDSFAQYGGWESKEAALYAYEHHDVAYAMHMLQHASPSRVRDAVTRERLESCGVAWHLVAPTKDALADSKAEAVLLLELVLLDASARSRRPRSRPDMPAHCREIFDRLKALQKRNSTRAQSKRARDDGDLSTEQLEAERVANQQCSVPKHMGIDHAGREWIVCAVSEGTPRSGMPTHPSAAVHNTERILGASAATYEALYSVLIRNYEPLPPQGPVAEDADRRDAFDLLFFHTELGQRNEDVLRALRAVSAASGSKTRRTTNSFLWMHTELVNAIDHHNGTLFDLLGDDCTAAGAAFVAERMPRDTRDLSTVKKRRDFHTLTGSVLPTRGCFRGWRARTHAPEDSGQADDAYRSYAVRESITVRQRETPNGATGAAGKATAAAVSLEEDEGETGETTS